MLALIRKHGVEKITLPVAARRPVALMVEVSDNFLKPARRLTNRRTCAH